jgi:hypothetical protein
MPLSDCKLSGARIEGGVRLTDYEGLFAANLEHGHSATDAANLHEANRLAYIKAMRTLLRLTEVYGLAESVTVPSGLRVDLFQALLSLELMTAFFYSDFMLPYMRHLGETGDVRTALGRLALGGLLQPGVHNRFPITWSDRKTKIASIVGWTVNEDAPRGSRKAAEAILDFWTSDWALLAARHDDAAEGGAATSPKDPCDCESTDTRRWLGIQARYRAKWDPTDHSRLDRGYVDRARP